jgi:NAD(P)-dependent dehydrogenase (short-subunit alcohol dehydrogenase family)
MSSPAPLPNFHSFTKSWHNKPYPFISPTRPELSAAGKNVVITGGGTGIGKAIGIAFAQAGARSVAIVGRRLDRREAAVEEIKQAAAAVASSRTDSKTTTQVLCEIGDVTNLESIKSALGNIVSQYEGNEKKIDIFAANAGVLPEEGPVFAYNEAELRKSFETNVMGTFNSLQAFLPLASPEAKLFNTGSGIGHWAPLPEVPGVFAYAATKAAALKMLDYFAAENPAVHVVSVMPGIIATEINPKITVGADTGMISVTSTTTN